MSTSKRRKHTHETNCADENLLTEQLWSSDPNSDTGGVFSHSVKLWWNEREPEVMCNIMQDETRHVTFSDLPSSWPAVNIRTESEETATDLQLANTAQLACGHVFHPTALALHFLSMDMRCPVCREGNQHRMSIDSVPPSVRNMFTQKQEELSRSESENMTQEDILRIVAGLELHMELRGMSPINHVHAQSRGIFKSRIPCSQTQINHILEQERGRNITHFPLINFSLHRSFQRLARPVLQRHAESLNNSVIFRLYHPLVPIPIASTELSASEALDTLFNCLTMQGTPLECAGQVPLYCLPVAGNEPVVVVQSKYSMSGASESTPTVSIDINMHMIINIATYVSQVIGTLVEATAMQDDVLGPQMLVPEIISIMQ